MSNKLKALAFEWLRNEALYGAKARYAAVMLQEVADLKKSAQPTEADASQGAMAIALIALLGECAPIRRWKEFEDRGEERIPCFIQVETAQAIAEFFP